LLIRFHRPLQRLLASTLCFAVVLIWWLGLAPSDNGQWQADVTRTAYTEVHASDITFHNVRSCDYRTESDYTCQWLTRDVDLDRVRGVDIFLDYWGSPWIAHSILSFDLGPDPSGADADGNRRIAFSIEAANRWDSIAPAFAGSFASSLSSRWSAMSVMSSGCAPTIAPTRTSICTTPLHRRPLPVPCCSTP